MADFQRDMKAAFMREHKRYSSAMLKIEQDLQEALQQQEAARLKVREVAMGAQPAADMGSLAESQEWENMMRNAMEDLEPASPMTGVLERALLQQAPPLSTGQSAARTPCPVVAVPVQESASAAPVMNAYTANSPGPCLKDPYMSSPSGGLGRTLQSRQSSPAGVPSHPASGPLGGRKSPHAPRAKVSVKEATKSAPSHQPPEASLRAKLQAKRAALQPFGVEPATAPPVAQSSGPGTVSSAALELSDSDLEERPLSSLGPPLGGME